MNRNHPYFKNNPMLTSSPSTHTPDVIANKDNVPAILTTPTTPLPMYQPRMVDPKNPKWNNDDTILNKLNFAFEDNSYSSDFGYKIDGIGQVYDEYENLHAGPGVITALSIVSDGNNVDAVPAHIVNTEDAGLRYVRFCNDGTVADLGPVEQTCLIGNVERAEGLYVPMCNTKSMADAAHLLGVMIKESTMNNRDLPSIEECTVNDTHDHECSCGGSCKCGGKCGNNCKCKSNKVVKVLSSNYIL